MKHPKLKLFIAGLITVQALCMIQGYGTTSDHFEFEKQSIVVANAQEALYDDMLQQGVPSNDHVDPVVLINQLFGPDAQTAVAIFRSESGLRANAKGWNCIYNGVAAACKTQDRTHAFSVDCGYTQENFAGTECPEESFNIEWNIKEAYAKYTDRGFEPWTNYRNGNYMKFLEGSVNTK